MARVLGITVPHLNLMLDNEVTQIDKAEADAIFDQKEATLLREYVENFRKRLNETAFKILDKANGEDNGSAG